MAFNFGILDIDRRQIVQDTLLPLAQYGNVIHLDPGDPQTFQEELQKIDVLIIRLYPVDRAFLVSLPRLKAVVKAGVGVDHIDVEAATQLGVSVSISLGNHISVAEAAILLMLSAARNLPYLNRNVKPDMSRLGIELYEKNLGLVGCGRIGSHVARIAKGLGMNVMINDPYAGDAAKIGMGCRFVDFETLLRESDVVSLHCPLTPETHHLLSDREFAAMKPSCIIVNTARGAVIDEAALCRALKDGRIAGAGLDVVENEPLSHDNPLLKLENAIVTPHRLIQSTDSLVRQTQSILESAITYSLGAIPESAVNKSKIKDIKS